MTAALNSARTASQERARVGAAQGAATRRSCSAEARSRSHRRGEDRLLSCHVTLCLRRRGPAGRGSFAPCGTRVVSSSITTRRGTPQLRRALARQAHRKNERNVALLSSQSCAVGTPPLSTRDLASTSPARWCPGALYRGPAPVARLRHERRIARIEQQPSRRLIASVRCDDEHAAASPLAPLDALACSATASRSARSPPGAVVDVSIDECCRVHLYHSRI